MLHLGKVAVVNVGGKKQSSSSLVLRTHEFTEPGSNIQLCNNGLAAFPARLSTQSTITCLKTFNVVHTDNSTKVYECTLRDVTVHHVHQKACPSHSTEITTIWQHLKRESKWDVRRQIKLANFCGRGLVARARENWPIKSLNHDKQPILSSTTSYDIS